MNWRTDNARDSLLRPGEEPALASHLVTPRAFYTHHGIYAGNGRVIHYSGLAYGWRRGAVVERACSRLGERSYRILTNNCEHFCAWALRGESYSSQVDWLRALPRRICAVLRAWIEGSGAIVERQATLMWSEADLSSDGPASG